MKKLLIAVSLLASSSVFASEQDKLAKWNTDVNKNIRQAHADKLAQTTYKEINVKDARVSDDISKVYPQIETKVTKDGSATRVVAEAVLDTDKEKVAKDWAKKLNTAAKYGKGVLGGAALGLLVDQLMDAIDYVMGEGGEIKKPNPKLANDIAVKPYHKLIYSISASHSATYYASYDFVYNMARQEFYNYAGYHPTDIQFSSKSTDTSHIYTGNNINNIRVNVYQIYIKQNPNYDPNAINPIPSHVPATEKEVQDAIKSKVLNNSQKQNLAKDIVKDSYARIWDDKGNSLEIRGDVSNKQKDIVSSDNPANEGHSTSTPTISDGKSGSGSSSSDSSSSGTSEGTTFNPDGSVASSSVTTTTTTSTSTTNIEFELPAFCDWASTVCEWLGWTQEPLEQDTELDIPDPEIPEIDTDISFTGECPADRTVYFPMPLGKNLEFTLSYQLLCEPLEQAKPVLIAVGLFLSALIVGGLRR